MTSGDCLLFLVQASELQQRLSATQSAESSSQNRIKELSADKQSLVSANQQLQQALMDKALEAASSMDGLRQQHARQLAALRQEQQQQVDELRADAVATNDQHQKVWAVAHFACGCSWSGLGQMCSVTMCVAALSAGCLCGIIFTWQLQLALHAPAHPC